MTHILTYDEALERLQIAAREREDYVNTIPLPSNKIPKFCTCRYLNPDNTPSCIIGVAWGTELIDAGLTFDSPENTIEVTEILSTLLNMSLTPKARELLEITQLFQDYGRTWGGAIYAGIIAARDFPDVL